MYRPQAVYSFPAPQFEDYDFDHYFDATNTPLLNNATLAAGGIVQNIPLILQSDAPFFLRGIQVKGINGTDPVVAALFKDPYNNNLSDDYVPLDLCVAPDATGLYFLNIVFEPELKCPSGGVLWVSLKNQTSGNQDLTKVRITLSGVKRYLAKGGRCAA